jgi:hypothetical protein
MTPQLFAPASYNEASPEVRAAVNGCGTAGWKGDLVPDTIWGLCITPSCNRHDWMYTCGSTLADKNEADRVFFNNMLRQIDAAGGLWIIKRLRRNRAWEYFEAVDHFGGPAFWDGKNPAVNLSAA